MMKWLVTRMRNVDGGLVHGLVTGLGANLGVRFSLQLDDQLVADGKRRVGVEPDEVDRVEVRGDGNVEVDGVGGDDAVADVRQLTVHAFKHRRVMISILPVFLERTYFCQRTFP